MVVLGVFVVEVAVEVVVVDVVVDGLVVRLVVVLLVVLEYCWLLVANQAAYFAAFFFLPRSKSSKSMYSLSP